MENLSDPYQEYRNQVQSIKNITIALCKDLLESTDISSEEYRKKSTSNVDLLLILDDLMDEMRSIVKKQLINLNKSLRGLDNTKYCFDRKIIPLFANLWSATLEKTAIKIIKLSSLTEKNRYQMITYLAKSVNGTIGKLFHQIRVCLELE